METAFQMLRRAMLRIVGLPSPGSLPRRITQPFLINRLVSSAPTAKVVSSWSAEQVQEYCRNELKLDAGALAMLKDNRVIGRTLLGIKENDLGRLGMKLGDASTLMDFVNMLRFGGEPPPVLLSCLLCISITRTLSRHQDPKPCALISWAMQARSARQT